MAVVLLMSVLSAAADMVWAPMDDYFGSAGCDYIERNVFMAAGEDGYAVTVRSPIDRTPVMIYPNGTELIIDYMCGTGDDLWGVIHKFRLPGEDRFTEVRSSDASYISSKDLIRSFDTDAFSELNSDRIEPFDPENFNPCAPHSFVIWSYPGSGVQMFEVTEGALSEYYCQYFSEDHYLMTTDRIYSDENGVRWVEIELLKPFVRGWVNYDDLTDRRP